MPYPDHPYRQAAPDQLAVAALAHGLEPPRPATARVLELGCGMGGTLLAVAAGAPEATFVGIDRRADAIAAGRARARAAGLANVELLANDVRALPAGLGTFDYVIAHGVYSWCAPDVRDALVAAVAAHLEPGGLGYVSHAALPAGHLLRVLREAALRHAGDRTGPERVTAARELLGGPLAARAGAEREHDWYGAFLAHELPRLLEAEPDVLLEDLLGDEWEPAWFHDFAAHLARHGLGYVGESRLLEPLTRVSRPGDVERLRAAAGGDRVAFEQYRDLADGRHFREAVIAHAADAAAARDAPDAEALRRMRFTALERPERPPEPPFEALRRTLLDARPAFLAFDALGAAPEHVLDALGRGQVLAHVDPPRVSAVTGRPVASPLARAQAAAGEPLSTLTCATLVLDEPGRRLVTLLDGTRDHARIADDLHAATGVRVDGRVLHALATAHLLVA